MTNEYEKGQEIGRLEGQLDSIERLLRDHIKNQDELNRNTDKRVRILEAWVQTTTGKIVILTTIFSGVGWVAYEAVKWYFEHKQH